MRLQHEQPKGAGLAVLEHVGEGPEVAERLRHLVPLDVHHAVVHPIVRELLCPRALGLRDLVLVVREDEVGPAAVDVEAARRGSCSDIAEHSMCQPGRPGPHGDCPVRLARLGRLPEREVARVTLAFVDGDPRARPSTWSSSERCESLP